MNPDKNVTLSTGTEDGSSGELTGAAPLKLLIVISISICSGLTEILSQYDKLIKTSVLISSGV